jgi:hypothetical protein
MGCKKSVSVIASLILMTGRKIDPVDNNHSKMCHLESDEPSPNLPTGLSKSDNLGLWKQERASCGTTKWGPALDNAT